MCGLVPGCTHLVEAQLVGRPGNRLDLYRDAAVFIQGSVKTACNDVSDTDGSDTFIRLRQYDDFVCISASDYCISSRIRVG